MLGYPDGVNLIDDDIRTVERNAVVLLNVFKDIDLVSYIKGGIQAKGILKQDPEANIWAQEG